MPFAFMPNLNQVTLLQLDGLFTLDEFKQAIEMATQGARKVYELQREALLRKYFAGTTVETTSEEVGE
jgi:exosome complex component RRP41